MNILFVCTGNSCRSVMAEYLLNDMAKKRGVSWNARSAGTAAERYFPTPEGVKTSLGERGIEVNHTPQLVGRELMDWAGLVVAMTRGHRDHLIDLYPEHTDKVVLFSEFAGQGTADVSDPIGKPVKIYRECADLLEKGISAALERHVTKSH